MATKKNGKGRANLVAGVLAVALALPVCAGWALLDSDAGTKLLVAPVVIAAKVLFALSPRGC